MLTRALKSRHGAGIKMPPFPTNVTSSCARRPEVMDKLSPKSTDNTSKHILALSLYELSK